MKKLVLLIVLASILILFFVFRRSKSESYQALDIPLTNYEQSGSGALLSAVADFSVENLKDVLNALTIDIDYTYCDGVKNTYTGGIDNIQFSQKYMPHEYDGLCLFSAGSISGSILSISNLVSGLSNVYLKQFQLTGRQDFFDPDKATIWCVFGFSFSLSVHINLNFDSDHGFSFSVDNIRGTVSSRVLIDIEKDGSDVKIIAVRFKQPCVTNIGYDLPGDLDRFSDTVKVLSAGSLDMKAKVNDTLSTSITNVFSNIMPSLSTKVSEILFGQPFPGMIWQDVINWFRPATGGAHTDESIPNNVWDNCNNPYVYYVLENCIFSGNRIPNEAFLPSELGHSDWHYKGKEYPFKPKPGYDGNCQYRENNVSWPIPPRVIEYLTNNDDWAVTGPTNAKGWFNCSQCSNAVTCSGDNSRTLSTCDLCNHPEPGNYMNKGIAYIDFKSNWPSGTKPEDVIGYFSSEIISQTRNVLPTSEWWPYAAVFRVPRSPEYQARLDEKKRLHGC